MGCGRNATTTDYKLAGVGLNPEEIVRHQKCMVVLVPMTILSSQVVHCPLVWSDWFLFGRGPALGTFEPPYGMVWVWILL